MRMAWTALALIVACGAWADSQPPAPTPPKTTQIDQDRTDHKDGHSTPSNKSSENVAPTSHFQINSQVNQTQTSDHSNDGNEHSLVNPLEELWSIGVVPALTLVLLGAQVWIYLKQRELMATQASIMQSSLEATQDTANAAKESANAAANSVASHQMSERAWVSWVGVIPVISNSALEGESGVSGTMFNIQWKNAGRTPAIRCVLQGQKAICDTNSALPTFRAETDMQQVHAPLVPEIIVTSPALPIRQADIGRLIKRQCKLFLYGRIDYSDTFSDVRKHTDVCFEVSYMGERATKNGAPEILYTFSPVGPQNSAS